MFANILSFNNVFRLRHAHEPNHCQMWVSNQTCLLGEKQPFCPSGRTKSTFAGRFWSWWLYFTSSLHLSTSCESSWSTNIVNMRPDAWKSAVLKRTFTKHEERHEMALLLELIVYTARGKGEDWSLIGSDQSIGQDVRMLSPDVVVSQHYTVRKRGHAWSHFLCCQSIHLDWLSGME